jgi:hypothetical protein
MSIKIDFLFISKKLVVVSLILTSLIYTFCFKLIKTVSADSPFSVAYTTLTNSRFSVVGRLTSGSTVPLGGNSITISTNTGDSGISDVNTDNLFPNDTVCFNNQASNGCSNQTTYTVSNVQDPSAGSTFTLSSGLTSTLYGSDRIIASQSGRIAISFKPTVSTNITGLRVYIPAATSTNNDGIPDIGKFDSNAIGIGGTTTPGAITASGGSISIGSTCSYALVTISGSYYHSLYTNVSGLDISNTFTLIIGHASNTLHRFINPSPSATTHTRGTADNLVITMQTEDSSNNIINKADMGVSPNDGVLVSAYVPTSVTWTISAVGVGETPCNPSVTMDIASLANAVPFGTIHSTATFINAAHKHTITTNAAGGYLLQVYEDNVLTNVGVGTTIPNTNCNTGCTTSSAAAWTNASAAFGFGYTVYGTDMASGFSGSNYKPFATSITLPNETGNWATTLIASRASTASNVNTYVCYRINIAPTQPAGFYYNKLTYVAAPRF